MRNFPTIPWGVLSSYRDIKKFQISSRRGSHMEQPASLIKFYGPFLWIEFNCIKATEPLQGDSLLLIT